MLLFRMTMIWTRCFIDIRSIRCAKKEEEEEMKHPLKDCQKCFTSISLVRWKTVLPGYLLHHPKSLWMNKANGKD